MKILHLDSSVTGEASITRPLTAQVAEKLLAANAGATLAYRNLVEAPLQHYTAVLRLHGATPEVATAAQKLELETGEALLAEFFASDVIVIGAPMYNFSVPSQLKAWVDLICVAGKTFKYGEAGPEGLCHGKRVVIVSARGGLYGPGSPNASRDFQEAYLKAVFGFLGIDAIDVIRAEGVAYGPDARAAAINAAQDQIAALI
ncbi:FMN-dependent NADH-azoreductase [Beijerinckia sp. L45]|uniref:FMN-dependent NADH-azoreductase n=1 Tax=Beijerinckia sp. L45 TaxID=1641855 RepID=UPI00131B9489|nr:NAD(P)H-dependent oxidoreductase [Beijerinckia sp. L45]